MVTGPSHDSANLGAWTAVVVWNALAMSDALSEDRASTTRLPGSAIETRPVPTWMSAGSHRH